MRKILAGAVIVVVSLFIMSIPCGIAQPIDYCEGNFDGDVDVDGTDAAVFKSDFGRSAFKNPCPPKVLAPIPKTGQTVVYASRDDGYWQQALGVEWPDPRFTDNGNGTVTDNLTGLIWLKNSNCYGVRDWSTALSDANGLSSGQCGLTDGSIAGEWRLPNLRELFSLVDAENYNPALPSNHPFTNVQADLYWSSTTYPGHTFVGRDVDMYLGTATTHFKYEESFVWPVRGGQ
jgi:hypothetical protein